MNRQILFAGCGRDLHDSVEHSDQPGQHVALLLRPLV